MLFSRPLILDSTLPVAVARSRVRELATSRGLPELEAFRRRQIIGWRLSELHEDFLFQPEYGDALSVEGARFIGLVEPAPSGSRIRGYVTVSALTKIVVSAFMLFVILAAMVSLGQAREPAAKVLGMASAMLGGAVLLVRYSLRSTSRLVEARLRQCLAPAEASAAA